MVGTKHGIELLNRMGVEDPYLIFQEASASQKESSARKFRACGMECQDSKSAASASVSTRRSKGVLDNSPLNEMPAGETMTDTEPVHINDGEGNAHDDKKDAPAFASYVAVFAETFDGIRSGFKEATNDNSPDSLAFYGYLMRYFEAKAEKEDFDLNYDKKTITEAVHSFESTKKKIAMAKQEKNLGLTVYQHLLSHIITKCKAKLPLPLA